MSWTSLYYHIVFGTSQRRAFLNDELRERVLKYIGGIVRNMNCQLLEGNGQADHVHLVGMFHPSVALAECVRTVRSNSSGWIHQTLPNLRQFAWQDGYAAFTVSPSVLPDVTQYVRNQDLHHRKMTFHEELVTMLRKHGIDFDERYV